MAEILSFIWRCAISYLEVFLGVVLVVGFRYNNRASSELERIGSDLSLYGYGIGVSLLCSMDLGRHVLVSLNSHVALINCAGLLINLLCYLTNLNLAERIRCIAPGHPEGLDKLQHLWSVISKPNGLLFFCLSLVLGFAPTFILIAIDRLGG